MAMYSGGSSNKKDLTFDIDENGHSTQSRELRRQFDERDISMVNIGSHCSYIACQQLEFLPHKCEYCYNIYCSTHYLPDLHSCIEYIGNDPLKLPPCSLCNKHITPPGGVVTREQYKHILQEHQDSDCYLYTFDATEAVRKKALSAQRCGLTRCNNHTASGKHLSLVSCPKCHISYCLSHRFPQEHECSSLLENKNDNNNDNSDKEKPTILSKSQQYLQSLRSTYQGKNETSKERAERQALQCKNPYLSQYKAKRDGINIDSNDNNINTINAVPNDNIDNELLPSSLDLMHSIQDINTIDTSILTPITLTPPQQLIFNNKSALLLAKTKSKNILVKPTHSITDSILSTLSLSPSSNSSNNNKNKNTLIDPQIIYTVIHTFNPNNQLHKDNIPQNIIQSTILSSFLASFQLPKILHQPLYFQAYSALNIKELIDNIISYTQLDKSISSSLLYNHKLYKIIPKLSLLRDTHHMLNNDSILHQCYIYEENILPSLIQEHKPQQSMLLPLHFALNFTLEPIEQQ